MQETSYTTEEKKQKFEEMIKRIKDEFGTQSNPYPNNILNASLKVYYGMSTRRQDLIIEGIVRMIVSAVIEDKFNPVDFSFPKNDYFEDKELNYQYLLEDFNTKLGDFLRNGRGIKFLLGALASLTDPFEAIEEHLFS